jgi:hypothetical protein
MYNILDLLGRILVLDLLGRILIKEEILKTVQDYHNGTFVR